MNLVNNLNHLIMCFEKNFKTRRAAQKFFNNPKIAEKDIKVYKFLDKGNKRGEFVPYYFPGNLVYKRGYIYYQDNSELAFHFNIRFWKYNVWELQISRGLHSSKRRIKNAKHCFEFIIPKGALYYENDYEYVSDQLLFPHGAKNLNR